MPIRPLDMPGSGRTSPHRHLHNPQQFRIPDWVQEINWCCSLAPQALVFTSLHFVETAGPHPGQGSGGESSRRPSPELIAFAPSSLHPRRTPELVAARTCRLRSECVLRAQIPEVSPEAEPHSSISRMRAEPTDRTSLLE